MRERERQRERKTFNGWWVQCFMPIKPVKFRMSGEETHGGERNEGLCYIWTVYHANLTKLDELFERNVKIDCCCIFCWYQAGSLPTTGHNGTPLWQCIVLCTLVVLLLLHTDLMMMTSTGSTL